MKMLNISLVMKFLVVLSASLAVGCAGTHTFNQYAKSGETIAIPVGHQPDWSRDNISVWIREPGMVDYVQYMPNDPRIRAVVNFYPDPLSSIVVSNRTGQEITNGALTFGNILNQSFTSNSRDWFQTVVFFDLPDPLALGAANVYVEEATNTNNFVNTELEIVGTGGMPHQFGAEGLGPMSREQLASLERTSHFAVTLSGSTIPHAVQLDFMHDPDVDNSGTGKAYIVEPISGVKNISWTDDGINLRIVILPADGATMANFNDFKFYVAGGINNLALLSTEAFDINGGSVAGVSTLVTPHNIVINTLN